MHGTTTNVIYKLLNEEVSVWVLNTVGYWCNLTLSAYILHSNHTDVTRESGCFYLPADIIIIIFIHRDYASSIGFYIALIDILETRFRRGDVKRINFYSPFNEIFAVSVSRRLYEGASWCVFLINEQSTSVVSVESVETYTQRISSRRQ